MLEPNAGMVGMTFSEDEGLLKDRMVLQWKC